MTDYGLSSQQLQVIDALSSGATMTEAAELAGVHRNTIANWRRNCLAFQFALAHAQYDRALLMREKFEALADLAVNTFHDLLADPATPPSVRLKAALAVLDTIATPPPPKQQVALDIERIKVTNVTEPITQDQLGGTPTAAACAPPQNVHKSAQQPRTVPPKIGRNEICPCGSGKKYKRCCLDKPLSAAA